MTWREDVDTVRADTPQDAFDAYGIAVATRTLIERQAA